MKQTKYDIYEIEDNKKQYLDLLLLADEEEAMIDKYLPLGRMFVLDDDGIKCAAVVLALDDQQCELKNIATYADWQGQGYGRAMVAFLLEEFLPPYQTMWVGTGEVPKVIDFYQKCGFSLSHRIENFFTDNYAHAMIEDGVQLRDMIYLYIKR